MHSPLSVEGFMKTPKTLDAITKEYRLDALDRIFPKT
jgi:hypothetical protein